MSFFRDLHSKLERRPSRHFDQRMSALMDQEMGVDRNPGFGIKNPLRLFVPAAVMAALVAVYFQYPHIPHRPNGELIPESIEFLQAMETLGSVEDDELITASDEEWAEALAEAES